MFCQELFGGILAAALRNCCGKSYGKVVKVFPEQGAGLRERLETKAKVVSLKVRLPGPGRPHTLRLLGGHN